jgi:hypothetical protein
MQKRLGAQRHGFWKVFETVVGMSFPVVNSVHEEDDNHEI